MILARVAHFASLISLAGIFAFLVFVWSPAFTKAHSGLVPGAATLRKRLTWLAWASLAIALTSGIFWLVLEAENMSGKKFTEVVSRPGIIQTVLTQTRFGQNWMLRFGVLLLLTGSAYARYFLNRGRPIVSHDQAALILGATALATVAGAGHASVAAGWQGDVHLAADAIHLLAAGAWLGGVVPLALMFSEMRRPGDSSWVAVARRATWRFSDVGFVSVGALLVTGLVNTWFLVDTMPALVNTYYGQLLLIKLGLFGMMVGVAASNRLRVTPQLCFGSESSDVLATQTALWRLQRNALIETGLGVAVIVIVGALGITPPALHRHPDGSFHIHSEAPTSEMPRLGRLLLTPLAIHSSLDRTADAQRTGFVSSLKSLLVADAFASDANTGKQLVGVADSADELLPPDRAFTVSISVKDANTLVAQFTPAKDYFLYRDKFVFRVQQPSEIEIANVAIPRGEIKDDPIFGKTEVFHRPVRVQVRLRRHNSSARSLMLYVRYQGCNEPLAVCYIPIEKTLRVTLPAAAAGR